MASRREQQGGDVEDRYRHVRHHPVFGRRGSGGQGGTADRRGRGAGSGPRQVRPVAPLASVRPAEAERPPVDGVGADRARPGSVRVGAVRVGGATAVRRQAAAGGRVRPARWTAGGAVACPGPAVGGPRPGPSRARFMVRRAVAAAVLVVVTASGVVALGLVADAVSAARRPASPTTVTVEAPGAPGGVSR